MPQRKSVQSLTDLCVQGIANNLDKFGSSSADAGRGISLPSDEAGIGDDELSCFESLPSQLVVSIMDAALMDWYTEPKNRLALLVTTHLDTLDLTQWPMLNDRMVLHLLRTAFLRHSPLKSLRFSVSGAVPCLVLKDLLPAFPNLKKLDASYSSKHSINDEFLALLSTCCIHLEELRLFWCKGVTDVGIQQLCGSQDGTGGVVRGCKFLVLLNVEGTGVTRHGARLALEHLQRLQIFDYHSTLQIAAEMHGTKGSSQQLNLKNLNAGVTWADGNGAPFLKGTLIDALRLCPFVLDVNIRDIPCCLDDADLAALLNLKCLKKLTIESCPKVSFDGGLLPILVKFGPSSLESLTLKDVREVNIGSIVEFCSQLRQIRLDDIGRFSPSRPGLRPASPRHFLPHLRRLTIRGCLPDLTTDEPSRADLSLLLGSAPVLEGIQLHRLRHLNGGVVEEAMAHHGFTHLKSFQVVRCPGITKGVVDRLLELDNPLSLISIERNNSLQHCSYRGVDGNRRLFDPAWGEKIRENNWDLRIHYCECARLN